MDEEVKYAEANDVPYETQRAMATALLFADIFKKELDSHTCENMTDANEIRNFSRNIMNHVLIVGGFPRDILLNRKIGDIDIIVNLRELTKLQIKHLNEYHSNPKIHSMGDNTKCIFYETWLASQQASSVNSNISMIDATVKAAKESPKSECQALHSCNFLLNSLFWLNLLRSNKELNNKISIKDIPSEGYMACEIVNHVAYLDIDLDGQKIEFIDTFDDHRGAVRKNEMNMAINRYHKHSRKLSESGIDIDNDEARAIHEFADGNNFGGIYSGMNNDDEDDERSNGSSASSSDKEEDTDDGKLDENNNNNNNNDNSKKKRFHKRFESMTFTMANNGISYEIPIFSGKLHEKLLRYDFSINTTIIPFNSVGDILTYYNNESRNVNDEIHARRRQLSWAQWTSEVENGLEECVSIEDIVSNKLLRVPLKGTDEVSILAHPEAHHFWRVIRWLIREPSFKVESTLLNKHIEIMDKTWMTYEYFKNFKKRKSFLKRMKFTIEKECASVDDIRQMFQALNLFLFNKKFINILLKDSQIGETLIATLQSIKHYIDLQSIYMVFQEFNYPISMWLQPIANNPVLTNKESIIQSAEISTLQKENKMLKEKLKENEESMEMMKQQIDDLIHSKLELAKYANEAIDQLRAYILGYQQQRNGINPIDK